jgi:hypothetical protein
VLNRLLHSISLIYEILEQLQDLPGVCLNPILLFFGSPLSQATDEFTFQENPLDDLDDEDT